MKYKQLTIEEREIIQQMLWNKESIRSIAKVLNRSPSTISREINKNIPEIHRRYTPRLANERALINRTSRGREDTTISHEAIYQYVYNQIYRDGYGYVKPECEDLRIYLRRKRRRRQPKLSRKSQRIFKPLDESINDRPELINSRLRYGDWESDTVESCNHLPGVNTLLERKSGLYLISKLHSSTSKETSSVIYNRMITLPRKFIKSITFDNGKENHDFNYLKSNLNIKTYHCNPYHSWERGSNENANGLLRDYYPKKTNFTLVSKEELSMVEYMINTRPRKRLNYLTPLEIINKEMGVAVRG